MTGDDNKKVLIVGAGPGGLLLAQFLRGQGIPYEIFERDEKLDSRAQGWAVALIACLPDIYELLPKDIGDFEWVSVNHGNDDNDSMALYDGITGELHWKFGGVAKGEQGYLLRASRTKMRQLFWEKANVVTGKEFTHYEEDESGVTVFFKDGSSARGGILVGADGARSRVRAQLLQDVNAKPVPSAYVAICGEGELPSEIYTPLRNMATSAILTNAPYRRCIFGQHAFLPEKNVHKFYYILGYRADEKSGEETELLAKASREELFVKATELTKEWQPILRNVIQHMGPQGMYAPPVKFQEFVPPESLPVGRVTILGDAGHTMIPFRGAGANTAFRDAADLTRTLRDAFEQGLKIPLALQEYAKVMLPRGREMVLESRAAGQDTDSFMRNFRATIGHVPESVKPTWD
ncbi:FAD/NAD(P)-binding domain-containing protein [Paramyrothecium foliicola]|nr:FAD/NAD(P)-binding domain-containing protein [Paramyrothecium foliicola]